MSAAGKRKRLTIEQKLKVINALEKGVSVKQLMIEYGIGEQTVRDIKKKKSDILSFTASSDHSTGFKNRKSMKKSTYENLDKAMLEWFNQQRASGTPLNGSICATQAKYFYDKLGLEGEFNASCGWLTRFKNRYGIREICVTGEKLSADFSAAEEFKKEFQTLINDKGLSYEQIYNADESGLLWKCLPTRTLAFQNEKQAPGHKVSKQRVTILCCGNASGNHKLQLTVIGKAKKPRSFKGTEAFIENLPVHYYNQRSAWMDKEIFQNWFHKKFVPVVRDHLKSRGLPPEAILLLDNAPSHPEETLLKSDDGKIFARFLPANVTPLIQPMDQGVISCLKRFYRSRLLQKYVDEGINLKAFLKEQNILEAIYDVAVAWDKVKATTLSNAWNPILKTREDVVEDDGVPKPSEIAHVAQSIDGGEEVDESNVINWLQCDDDDPGFEQLTGQEIADRILDNEDNITLDDGKEETYTTNTNTISHGDALTYVEGLLEYLEGQNDSLLTDKISLRLLRSTIKKKENASKKQTFMTDYFKQL